MNIIGIIPARISCSRFPGKPMAKIHCIPMLDDSIINIVNLMAKIETVEEFADPNEVKVVVDPQSNAIYFSRKKTKL